MPFIVTLISPKPIFTKQYLEGVMQNFSSLTAIKTLREGYAVEFNSTIAIDVSGYLKDQAVDYACQPANHRRKKLLIADMDSTMIHQECIDELADYVGKKAFVSEITERAMRGELAFEPALRERVLLLKGLPLNIVDEVIANKITLMEGAKTLVHTMGKHGAYTALVSGGFTAFTQKIGTKIGFDENRANILLHEGGHLSGYVQEPILGKEAKRASLEQLSLKYNIDLKDTLAVGDGANDLAMIKVAGLGVAYHAKPAVAKEAHVSITHNDLTALLYLQGYEYGEFAHYN